MRHWKPLLTLIRLPNETNPGARTTWRKRSAGFQPAVSPIVERLAALERLRRWRIGNPRYSAARPSRNQNGPRLWSKTQPQRVGIAAMLRLVLRTQPRSENSSRLATILGDTDRLGSLRYFGCGYVALSPFVVQKFTRPGRDSHRIRDACRNSTLLVLCLLCLFVAINCRFVVDFPLRESFANQHRPGCPCSARRGGRQPGRDTRGRHWGGFEPEPPV